MALNTNSHTLLSRSHSFERVINLLLHSKKRALVTFLLLRWNVMAETTYRGGFIWACGSRGLSPAWWGSVAARGKRGSRSRKLEAHILNLEQETERVNGKCAEDPLKPVSSDTLPPAETHLLTLPKQHCQLGTRYSNMGARGLILTQTSTSSMSWTILSSSFTYFKGVFSPIMTDIVLLCIYY